MLKLPKVVIRVAAKRKFDAWIASYSLANATAICKQLQKLFREEKKRRRELEGKSGTCRSF